MIIDAHTHTNSNADISVINFYPDNDIPDKKENDLLSAGLHPWYIRGRDLDKEMQQLKNLCSNRAIQAIGECGLDVNVGDINLQKSIFKQHINLSNQYNLPVIIHSVKTYHLILKMRKSNIGDMPWLVHGYQGSKEMALQFCRQKIFISFGAAILKHPKKMQALLNQADMNYVLFETDDSEFDIKDIYLAAAEMLGISLIKLEKQIETNFKKVFG